jgi:hypothetical protein
MLHFEKLINLECHFPFMNSGYELTDVPGGCAIMETI